MVRSQEQSTKVSEDVNGLRDILSLQVILPNLIGFNGLLSIPILSVTLRMNLEERCLAVSTVPQYFFYIRIVLLLFRGHSSNLLRIIGRHRGAG